MTTKSALLISITFMALLIEGHGIRVERGIVSSLHDRKDQTEKNGEHMVEANKEKREKLSAESSSISNHGEEVADHYPDILDIAGMDYSSAKRKPPIHN
ncbi:hypothetical protein Syun_025516 [Stephania yunnanensis]|uniref:Uncharacterized protein n=1 Tax=Stephania yunnanensis TaxID=152371 RepID=A0AAP0ESD2_9MAGN